MHKNFFWKLFDDEQYKVVISYYYINSETNALSHITDSSE